MNFYRFKIEIGAYGSSPEAAWLEACAAFGLDYGEMPEDFTVEKEEEEEED